MFLPSLKPIEKLNLKDWNCITRSLWADHAQRENSRLLAELTHSTKNNHTRYCQELKELRRVCCKHADGIRQLRRTHPTASPLPTPSPGFAEKSDGQIKVKETKPEKTASPKKTTQEIAKNSKNRQQRVAKKTDRARQARIYCLRFRRGILRP